MPSTIDKFLFKSPKEVRSGSSIQLQLTVTVSNPPKTLKLQPSAGYACQPVSRTYTTPGSQDDDVFVVLTGPAGDCILTGKLGASEAEDVAEVT
jgi:hypothetical protein